MLEPAIRDLASTGKNFATIAVQLPNGQIASHVMWVDADDDQLLVNTEVHRAKYKAIQQHPEVTRHGLGRREPVPLRRGPRQGDRRGPRRRRPRPTSTRCRSATSATTTRRRSRASASCCAITPVRQRIQRAVSVSEPRSAVLMGSASDWSTMQAAVAVLERFGVAHEAKVVSAHRMPDEMFAYAEPARGAGPAGDHRRRRRRRPPAGDAGGQDDRARARRAGARPATCRARTRCCRSSRCRPASRWPRSPSARPGRRTPRCSPSPCWPPTTTPLAAALAADRAARHDQAVGVDAAARRA